MTIDQAKKHVKLGIYACFFSATITFLVIVYAILNNAQDEFASYNDPWMFLDVLLILLCAWGLKKYSRTAAISIFVYFLISKISLWLDSGQISGLGLGLLFLYFYFQAIRGTFFYHKHTQLDNPSHRKNRRWIYYLGIPVVLIFLFILIMGLLIDIGYIPDSLTLRGEEITQVTTDILLENHIINPEEEIIYFYSAGIFSFLEDGNILTNSRVISYEGTDSTFDYYSSPLDSIESVSIISNGDILEDAIYLITTLDSTQFYIMASTEEERSIELYEAIQENIKCE